MPRGKRKVSGGDAVAAAPSPDVSSKPFVSDPHPDRIGLEAAAADPSVYFAVYRRPRPGAGYCHYRLYKAKVNDGDDSSSPESSRPRKALRRVGRFKTDVGAKTFVSLRSRWIVAVGGARGGTDIFDTATRDVIRGPNLVAAKDQPVLATVGYGVYALSRRPSYVHDPDFVPWFEVLDLSRATITASAADGSLRLDDDSCAWTALPPPPCIPWKLTPRGFLRPPAVAVWSHVVVEPYILVSINHRGTHAFDTSTGEWHKLGDEHLPFAGAAIPHGHGGCTFLGRCPEADGPIKVYRIRILSSGKEDGGALKLSVTESSLAHEACEEVGATGAELRSLRYVASLDGGRFSLLDAWYHKYYRWDYRARIYDKELLDEPPTELNVKLATYQMRMEEDPEEEMITVSRQQEQEFKIYCSQGFMYPPIVFAFTI